MSELQDRAAAKFMDGANCAQAVLWALAERAGLDPETALKIATGLGAGLGRRQETCGALTGGILALGLLHGAGEGADRAVVEATYDRVRALIERFEREHGASRCRELLDGCDLTTDEGRQAVADRDLKRAVCLACVRSVVAALEE